MDEQQNRIPLDGSYGLGPDAELTVITRTPDGRQQEKTYTTPYSSLNLPLIQKFCDVNLILGYRIVKNESNNGLKDLGL